MKPVLHALTYAIELPLVICLTFGVLLLLLMHSILSDDSGPDPYEDAPMNPKTDDKLWPL